MGLSINLLELELDPLTRVSVYRRPYESGDQLEEIRGQLVQGQFITRLGDAIWGYLLPESFVKRYGFSQFAHLAVAFDPRFINRLLRYATGQRLEQMGFHRTGYDKFERPGEIAFALGDRNELVARSRWLVRPFSLPSDHSSFFALLINPRLAYRFKVSLAQLSREGFHWSDFGDKVRAATREQTAHACNLWEIAHTALVKDSGEDTLFCEWRDGEKQEVNLAQCWPIASTENRYSYLRRRYSGFRGEQLARSMKDKDDDFFALENVRTRIKSLGESIGQIKVSDDFELPIGDFLEVATVSRRCADELQASLMERAADFVTVDESVGSDGEDDEDHLEEIVQLELF
jgi:hypothetical protein